MYSSKHQGLYLYLYRILQPIWETKITSTDNCNLGVQTCNISIFLPVRDKLQDLYDFITKNANNLQGKIYDGGQIFTENDQEVLSLFELNHAIQDCIKVAEKQSCIELKAFLRRCLDVIDFLDHIAPSQQEFDMIVQDLEQQMRDTLSTTSFKDLVSSNSNPLVRKILVRAIQINSSGQTNKTIDLIRLRANKAQKLCKTLFSPGENQVFIGESLLQNSLKETDIQRKEKLVKEAVQAFESNPRGVDIQAILPQLAENANFKMINHLCIVQLQRLQSSKETQKIEDLYEIIVTMFNMINRVITDYARVKDLIIAKRIDPEIDGQYALIFLEQLIKVKEIGQHINMRDQLFDMILVKKEWHIIDYIFRFFLLRDQNVDFITEKLNNDVLKKYCDSFIDHQSRTQHMTRSQFNILKRIFEKKNQIESLASLVVQVATDQIILKRREIFLERPNPGQLDRLEMDQWFEDQPTCEKRLEMVNWTSKLLKDAQNNLSYGPAMRLVNQSSLQTGNLVERYISLEKELENCRNILIEQNAAIKSAQMLLENIQKIQIHQQHNPVEQNRLNELKCFIIQLNQRLMSIDDLTSKYYEFDIADRKAYVLIHKSQPTDKLTQEELKAHQLKAIKDLIEVTHEINQRKQDFEKAVLQQLEMLFGNLSLDERLTQFLLLYVDYVSILEPVSAEAVKAGTSWWIAEFILGKMCIQPSKFIKKIAQQVPERPSKHIAIMASFRMWMKLVSVCNNRFSKLANQTAINDLKNQGQSIYNEILLNISRKWLEDNQLTLQKEDYDSIDNLLSITCEEFENLLAKFIVGYQPNQLESKPELKLQIEPKVINSPHLRAPQRDINQEEHKKNERFEKIERNNQSQRSFTPARAIIKKEQRQVNNENQLVLDNLNRDGSFER